MATVLDINPNRTKLRLRLGRPPCESRDRYGVEFVGPIRPNRSWQAEDDDAYDVTRFEIDWEPEVATCPEGTRSRYWKPAKRLKNRTSQSSTVLPRVAGALP